MPRSPLGNRPALGAGDKRDTRDKRQAHPWEGQAVLRPSMTRVMTELPTRGLRHAAQGQGGGNLHSRVREGPPPPRNWQGGERRGGGRRGGRRRCGAHSIGAKRYVWVSRGLSRRAVGYPQGPVCLVLVVRTAGFGRDSREDQKALPKGTCRALKGK